MRPFLGKENKEIEIQTAKVSRWQNAAIKVENARFLE